MNILVLGSEGLIGKFICDLLNKNNFNVVRWDIKLNKLHDLRKENCIDEILKTIDYVIFLAFDVGGAKYNVNTEEFINNNMKIILYTFGSLSKNPKPFIYTSSCMSNMITNPYGSLKNISEFYVKILNGVTIKLWNIYGYENISEKSHVIPDFIHSAINEGTIKIQSNGNEKRQFLHVEDLSNAILIIINKYPLFKNKIIDISSYKWISIYKLAKKIKYIFKKVYNIEIIITKGNGKDNHTNKNVPIKNILNTMWKDKINLNNGLLNIIKNVYE